MMLGTDDVDDDFFTPIASTSLANIFGTNSKKQENKDNESLKYTPPKQQSIAPKLDDSKLSQCIFATAGVGYEWSDNVYICRGNLGFAILKIVKTGLHNIILYDSRKTTLSSAAVIPTLEVSVNNNQSISYYDSLRKYWSISVNEDNIKTILSFLKSFNVQVKFGSQQEKNPPDTEKKDESARTESDDTKRKDIGSDTDSSINRKTKMTILNRMANVGHSVLPTDTINIKDKSSDSSDTSEHLSHAKAMRHKPVKNIMKRINTEKTTALCTPQKVYEPDPSQISLSSEKVSENPALFTYVNGVLVPVTSTSLISTPIDKSINNMDFFANEQRMNNTEMRINVNRITDKVDQIIQKLNNIEQKSVSGNKTNFDTDIYQKLLVEYENKIKVYEDLLKTKNSETKTNEDKTQIHSAMESHVQELKMNIVKLELGNQEKASKICSLEEEISLLKQKVNTFSLPVEKNGELEKIKDLEVKLLEKEAQLKDAITKYESLLKNQNESDIEEKIKNIMNNTFQTISGNFENNESYSGEAIKKIIAVVIRNITMNSLNNIV